MQEIVKDKDNLHFKINRFFISKVLEDSSMKEMGISNLQCKFPKEILTLDLLGKLMKTRHFYIDLILTEILYTSIQNFQKL